MKSSLGSVRIQLKHHVFVYIQSAYSVFIRFTWHRNPNFVVQETNDGNYPGLGLDINIINQIDDGDVTEGIDSGLEAILGLSRALLVVRKCENKRNL